MSERFEDEYRKLEGNIKPSEDFRLRLENILEIENKKQSEKKGKTKRYKSVFISLAACVVIAVTVFLISSAKPVETAKPETPGNMGNMNTPFDYTKSFNVQSIGSSEWFDKDNTPEQCVKFLAERIRDKSDLAYIKANNENTFADVADIDEKQINELADMLDTVTVTNIDIEKNEAEYYMAVFGNGDIAKFTVYNNKYIIISGLDAVFEK